MDFPNFLYEICPPGKGNFGRKNFRKFARGVRGGDFSSFCKSSIFFFSQILDLMIEQTTHRRNKIFFKIEDMTLVWDQFFLFFDILKIDPPAPPWMTPPSPPILTHFQGLFGRITFDWYSLGGLFWKFSLENRVWGIRICQLENRAAARFDARDVRLTQNDAINWILSLFSMLLIWNRYDTCFIVISGALITILPSKTRNNIAVARYDAHCVHMTHNVAVC